MPEKVEKVLGVLHEAAIHREAMATYEDSLGLDVHKNAWDLGRAMWLPGTEHLPNVWKTETCPKDLGLREVPTLKIYRALALQTASALLAAMPKVRFAVQTDTIPPGMQGETAPGLPGLEEVIGEDLEAANETVEEDLGEGMGIDAALDEQPEMPTGEPGEVVTGVLNGAWEEMARRSRILAELSTCIIDNWNYGISWLGLHDVGGEPSKQYIKAVHPQIVLWDLNAERDYEIDWVAKMVATGRRDGSGSSLVEWPKALLPKPDDTGVDVELFVRRGGKFGGKAYGEGLYLRCRSDGELLEEGTWQHDVLPMMPVVLEPGHGLFGTSVASEAWHPQVTIDKVLAVLLSRAGRASGEIITLGGPPASAGERMPEGTRLNNSIDEQLRRPGVRVVTYDGEFKVTQPQMISADMQNMLAIAISNLERAIGLTPAWQGHLPRGVESGVAIASLAKMGGRRIDRMAAHLTESLRIFARNWAEMYLKELGADETLVEVDVQLEVNVEDTRARQFQAVVELARAGVQVPPEMLVKVIPGLTETQRETLLEDMLAAEEHRAAMGIRGSQEPAAGEPTPPVGDVDIGVEAEPLQPPGGGSEYYTGEGEM
mgnify:CR=1 FL=1